MNTDEIKDDRMCHVNVEVHGKGRPRFGCPYCGIGGRLMRIAVKGGAEGHDAIFLIFGALLVFLAP